MKINPVKGTNDYLPEQTALRDRLQETILSVYLKHLQPDVQYVLCNWLLEHHHTYFVHLIQWQ